MSDHPARQAHTERWLDDLGASWAFDGDLVLHRIDGPASLANQVRRHPLDAEVVERYQADMIRGDAFPPLLVAKTTAGVLFLLGGNHRYAAHVGAGHTTAPAYVITADDAVLLRIRVEDNRRHGLPTTTAERIDHALALIASGMSQKQAAAIVGVPQPKVSIAASVAAGDRRAGEFGIDARYYRLSQQARYQLSLVDDPDVFAALAGLAATAGMPASDIKRLQAATAAVDTVEALRIVGQEEHDWTARRRDLAGNVRGSSRTPRARFDTALAEIIGLEPAEIADTCPTGDVAAVLAQRVMRAAQVMAQAYDLLDTRSKTPAA